MRERQCVVGIRLYCVRRSEWCRSRDSNDRRDFCDGTLLLRAQKNERRKGKNISLSWVYCEGYRIVCDEGGREGMTFGIAWT